MPHIFYRRWHVLKVLCLNRAYFTLTLAKYLERFIEMGIWKRYMDIFLSRRICKSPNIWPNIQVICKFFHLKHICKIIFLSFHSSVSFLIISYFFRDLEVILKLYLEQRNTFLTDNKLKIKKLTKFGL